ncbi:MAG: C13 family peptidase [Gammaproteobacteria bacterium]
MVQLINDLKKNLRCGLRLASFRPCDLGDFRFSLDQIMVLMALDLSLEIVSDYLFALPKPQFIIYALPTYAFNLLCLFLAAYLIGKLLNSSTAVLQIGVAIYSFAPFSILGEAAVGLSNASLLSSSPKAGYWLEHLFSLYVISVIFRALYLISGRLKRMALPSLIVMIVFLSPTQILFSDYRDFWFVEDKSGELQKTDPYAGYRSLDAETLMYRQPEIVAKTLSKLKPQRKKMTDIYFVGFAGFAMEDVFGKEVRYVKQLLDNRFDTKGRSMNLINHLDTIEDAPLATSTNLALTLNRIGKLMDVENDVLILYLTSHGSKNRGLSVSFWPLVLNDLTPEMLKTIFDESGIKWRVIVVSACYSGIFVKALQGPTTLVATAAAADKASFGCGTESEFTYFGEAVFKEQLAHHYSIAAALQKAADSIGRREQVEKLDASLPQLSIGAAIEPKLQRLSERLRRYRCPGDGVKAEEC